MKLNSPWRVHSFLFFFSNLLVTFGFLKFDTAEFEVEEESRAYSVIQYILEVTIASEFPTIVAPIRFPISKRHGWEGVRMFYTESSQYPYDIPKKQENITSPFLFSLKRVSRIFQRSNQLNIFFNPCLQLTLFHDKFCT